MELKQCPKCERYSVFFDFNRGVEICHWRDCSWVNSNHEELPVAHKTEITKGSSQIADGQLEKAYKAGQKDERQRISNYLEAKYGNVGRGASRTALYRIAKDLAIELDLDAAKEG